jgi:transcription antitermination protein NusB
MNSSNSVHQRAESVAAGVEERAQSSDHRRVARELAMQFLYQLDAQQGASLVLMDLFLNEYTTSSQAAELARQFITATWRNLDKIDGLIRVVSLNWDFTRISPVDRGNLRLAVHQLLACPDIPPKVVINEAVELAKRFSTAQAPAFVNGVLDVIMKKLKTPPPAAEKVKSEGG